MTSAKITEWDVKILLSEDDQKYVKELESKFSSKNSKRPQFTKKEKNFLSKLPVSSASGIIPIVNKNEKTEKCREISPENVVNLNNIISLYNTIHCQENLSNKKRYLYEMLGNAQLLIPENEIIPRNPELEKRCQKLRREQENYEYASMTKNVDSSRKTLPEDTIAYQIKSINKQLIAIFQFVVSVVTGFVFGFLGLELIFGGMEFGFRLLLGIICALIIALAEIYFLAKKLNEYDEFVDSPTHNYINDSKKND